MDCLLCFKMFIGEKEFQNSKQNPQVCKKAIFELFRISIDTDLQGLSEDFAICLGCHRKLECVRDLVEQLKELQRKVDEAKIEIKKGLIDSKKVSEVMAQNFGDSMSKSSLDRLVLLKAIKGFETKITQESAADHDGIDVGGPNDMILEPSEDQQSQELADEPETRDFTNELEGILPAGVTMLKEVKVSLERVQLPPGVFTVKNQVKSNTVPSNSNGGDALRNPNPPPETSTLIENSSDEKSSSDSKPGGDLTSEDDTMNQTEAYNMSKVSTVVYQVVDKQPRRARGSVLEEFTRLENGLFRCKHCPNILTNKMNLSKHFSIHRSFKCSIQRCGKRFVLKSTRDIHVKLVHEKKKDFKCSRCRQKFSTAQIRNSHVKTVHERRTDFKCEFDGCGKAFARKDYLQKHMSAKHKRMRVVKKKRVEVARVSGHQPVSPKVKVGVLDCRMTTFTRRVFNSESSRNSHESHEITDLAKFHV